jgi:hypothetical protein
MNSNDEIYKQKYIKYKTKYLKFKQKGGVLDKLVKETNCLTEQECFNFFLSNLKNVSYFKKGTFGLTFILELKDDVESPYKYMDGTQIKKVLLKVVGICTLENKNTKDRMITYEDSNYNSYNTLTLTKNVLEKECRLQKKIYDCGKTKSIQLCPKMFYCDIKTIEESTSLLDTLITSTGYVKPKSTFLNKISTIIRTPPPPPLAFSILSGLNQNLSSIDGLSFSLMEYADGYKTISKNNQNDADYARVALLKLAIFCGVSHSDPNQNNILINQNNHVLLIDFGSTIEDHDKDIITEEEKTQIIENLNKKNYEAALEKCNKFYKPALDERGWPMDDNNTVWVHKGIKNPNIIIDEFIQKYISIE